MNSILFRIRKVFKDSGKSQTEIGKLINKTPQYVWRILNVDNINPSESVIKDICQEFNISEIWLRTGEGEMQKPYTDTLAYLLGQIAAGDDDLIEDLIISYMELDATSKQALRQIRDNMVAKQLARQKEREQN